MKGVSQARTLVWLNPKSLRNDFRTNDSCTVDFRANEEASLQMQRSPMLVKPLKMFQ